MYFLRFFLVPSAVHAIAGLQRGPVGRLDSELLCSILARENACTISDIADVFRRDPSTLLDSIWKEASTLGDKAIKLAKEEIIELAASTTPSIAEVINDLNAAWTNVATTVISLSKLQPPNSDQLLERPGFKAEDFATFFIRNMKKVFENLRAKFELPLPEDESKRYKQRKAAINLALNATEDVLVEACKLFRVPSSEEEIRKDFGRSKSQICDGILTIGKLVDDHPALEALVIAVILEVLLPENVILLPILRLFGIAPKGPVKGSLAAAAQRYFFGSTIPAGSWFSKL